MGAWGTGLYENDFACDVRDSYIDQLKRGKSNEEATNHVINWFRRSLEMDYDDDRAIFWFVMADTQWEYGRLLPMIKQQALYHAEYHGIDERWVEVGSEEAQAWNRTVSELAQKLKTTQPCEKKVPRYRIYQCTWKIGDVFAYRMDGEYSTECGYHGKYILFRKIENTRIWPDHIVPIIQLYNWTGDVIPDLDEINELPWLNLSPFKHLEPKWFMILCTHTTPKKLKERITLLGNIPTDNVKLPGSRGSWESMASIGMEWSRDNRKLETYFIHQYELWATGN